MTKTETMLPAAGSKGYSAADVLRLARELGVGGKLVKRYRSGRELRAYAIAGDSAPMMVSAGADAHTLPAGETPVAKPAIKGPRPTALNLWVLGRIANGRREFPNRISSTSSAHIRRCVKAGLVEICADRLRITDEGFVALVDRIATSVERYPIPSGEFTTEVCE